MKIFVDIDEVLADFVGKACEVHNISKDEVEEELRPEEWLRFRAMGTVKGLGREMTP